MRAPLNRATEIAAVRAAAYALALILVLSAHAAMALSAVRILA